MRGAPHWVPTMEQFITLETSGIEWSTLNLFSKVQLGFWPLRVLWSPLLSSSVPRDLAPRDISGTSDPFARVFWGSQSLETSVSGGGDWERVGHWAGGGVPASSLFTLLFPQTIKKTRFPHWDEVLELRELPGAPSPLRVELWDWDMVGKNDFLGMVSAPQHSPWLPTASNGDGRGDGLAPWGS